MISRLRSKYFENLSFSPLNLNGDINNLLHGAPGISQVYRQQYTRQLWTDPGRAMHFYFPEPTQDRIYNTTPHIHDVLFWLLNCVCASRHLPLARGTSAYHRPEGVSGRWYARHVNCRCSELFFIFSIVRCFDDFT